LAGRIQDLANAIVPAKLSIVTGETPGNVVTVKFDLINLQKLSEEEMQLFNLQNFASMTIQSIVDVKADDFVDRAIDFQRLELISKYPDAASLLGGSGISFKGTSAGSVATVKANVSGLIPKLPISFLDTIALSAPTAKSGNVDTFATLDGLASADAVELTGRFTTLPGPKVPDQALFYGYDLKYGVQSATYYDTKSLAKKTENEDPYSAGGFVGYAFGQFKQSILLKYSFQSTYSDSTTKVLCPTPNAEPITCVNGPAGSPTHTLLRVATLQYLAQPFPKFALAPSINYDAVARIKGVDLPLYFIPADTSTTSGSGTSGKSLLAGLTGGVDIGYRSDTHWEFGLIVGAAFSVFGL
jgi:hypothetical protein